MGPAVDCVGQDDVRNEKKKPPQKARLMRLLRMTTTRWMTFVALISAGLALLMFLRQLAANKVSGFEQRFQNRRACRLTFLSSGFHQAGSSSRLISSVSSSRRRGSSWRRTAYWFTQ